MGQCVGGVRVSANGEDAESWGTAPPSAIGRLLGAATARGWTVEWVDEIPIPEHRWLRDEAKVGVVHGRTDWKRQCIQLRRDLPPPMMVRVLAHELAHLYLHITRREHGYSHLEGVEEIEAESVAALVARCLDVDTSTYSALYMMSWLVGAAAQYTEETGDPVPAEVADNPLRGAIELQMQAMPGLARTYRAILEAAGIEEVPEANPGLIWKAARDQMLADELGEAA